MKELKEDKPIRQIQMPKETWLEVLELARRIDLRPSQFMRRAIRNEIDRVRREIAVA